MTIDDYFEFDDDDGVLASGAGTSARDGERHDEQQRMRMEAAAANESKGKEGDVLSVRGCHVAQDPA